MPYNVFLLAARGAKAKNLSKAVFFSYNTGLDDLKKSI
jgi:hypothetical protein